jgi:hypothetical protein
LDHNYQDLSNVPVDFELPAEFLLFDQVLSLGNELENLDQLFFNLIADTFGAGVLLVPPADYSKLTEHIAKFERVTTERLDSLVRAGVGHDRLCHGLRWLDDHVLSWEGVRAWYGRLARDVRRLDDPNPRGDSCCWAKIVGSCDLPGEFRDVTRWLDNLPSRSVRCYDRRLNRHFFVSQELKERVAVKEHLIFKLSDVNDLFFTSQLVDVAFDNFKCDFGIVLAVVHDDAKTSLDELELHLLIQLDLRLSTL